MIERRTVSQCISSDYCKGWNDAVDELAKVFDAGTILALKAVLFGCGSNNKLVNGTFAHNIFDSDKLQMISFSKAVEIVESLSNKIESFANGGEQK